jgi:hypothetical protein
VKVLRVCVLLLLAVLLPVRGVMAATMSCEPAAPAHHAMSDHDHGPHAHDGDDPAGHDHASQERCTMCSATCSTPPLPSAAAGLEEPVALTAMSYPDLAAPVPAFQSDGQERPPRTS